jgi:hypothetical protein
MNKPLGIFFIGIFCGFLISEADAFSNTNHPNNLSEFLFYSVHYSGFFGNMSYYIILILLLPTIVIPQIKNKMGSRVMPAYFLAAGISFWAAADGIYIILT